MSNQQGKVDAEFPKKLAPLFQPMRYKIAYGGRGGAKSWSIARALVIKGSEIPLRVLCAREVQKSIADSVYRLLVDQINRLGLQAHYTITKTSIKGKNGTEFFFEGLRHNPNGIKSYEGIDIVWIEEAVTVSKHSWGILIPTIRKDDSEIWVSFNPELEEDDTYQRFVVNPPENSVLMHVSWRDNPWFPPVLIQEKDELFAKDINDYNTVWEGECRPAVEGAIYAEELKDADRNNRIKSVPYDPSKPVNTFWDLGWADNTSIWFVQKVGFEFRVIDFYQNSRMAIQHYVKMLQEKPYIYGKDHLPHDARAKSLGTGKSIEETLIELGRKVSIVPLLSVTDGLSAVRTVFPMCYFDKDKCADGLQGLRRYRYDVNKDTGRESRAPLHDINSHPADAFRYFASAPHVMWDAYVESKGHGSANTIAVEYDPYAPERL